MSLAQLGDRQVFFETHGSEGEQVVLLHSLGADHSVFEEQARALSRKYSVLTFDMRGHGQSTLGDRSPSLEVLADDVRALLSHLKITEAHLVGQSIGGMTLLAFAARFPHWPGSFAVLSCTASTNASWDRKYTERADVVEEYGVDRVADDVAKSSLGATTRAQQPLLVDRYVRTLKRADRRGYAWACRAMVGFELRPSLTEISSPVLVAAGEEDVLTNEERAREISDAIPNSQLRTIPECGHVPCLEKPDAVTQLLDDWFEIGATRD
jgi:3-oxoadipate enol-lactonase